MELQARETPKCGMQTLTDQSGENLGGQNASRKAESKLGMVCNFCNASTGRGVGRWGVGGSRSLKSFLAIQKVLGYPKIAETLSQKIKTN